MKKLNALLSRPWIAYTFAACSAVLLFVVLTNISPIGAWLKKALTFLSPVFTGIVVAYLLNPMAEFFKRTAFKKVKKESTNHMLGVVLTVAIVVVALLIVIGSLIPSIVKSISKIVSEWDNYVEFLEGLLEKIEPLAKKLNIDLSNLSAMTDELMDKAFNIIQSNKTQILKTISSAGSSLSNFGIGVLFGVCFLVAKKPLVAVISSIRAATLKKERLERQNALLNRFHTIFIKYIACTLVDAIIIGVCMLIFMLILNPGYAALIAVISAFTNIIPTIGPIIGSVIAIFFLILENPWSALWYFIFSCILQTLDGMVIKPRLFKGSLGVPGVWTFVFMIIGGKVAGMVGIVLSIPVVAILVIIYNEMIEPRLGTRANKINSKSSAIKKN